MQITLTFWCSVCTVHIGYPKPLISLGRLPKMKICLKFTRLSIIIIYYFIVHEIHKKEKRNNNKNTKTTQTEQQIDYKVRLDGKYKKDTAISLAHAEHFRNCKARFWTLVCVNRNTNYSMCACFTLHSSLLNWDRIWNRIRLISWMPKDTAIGVLTMFTCVRIDIASETWSATVGVHERIVLHTFAARRKVITMSLHWLFVATRYSQQYTSLIRVGYVHCLKNVTLCIFVLSL